MIKVFELPDLGEGLTESEIVSWKVAVGDAVTLNQVIAEVETAKAVVELPSPYEGIISQLHEQPGTVVDVGKPIVSFELPGSDDAPADDAPKRVPTLVGYGAEPDKGGRPARRARANSVVAPVAAPEAEPAPVVEAAVVQAVALVERPRSTPPVRKLARDLGIDLTAIPGTGLNGLITREDVQVASSAGAVAPVASAASGTLASATLLKAQGEREVRTPIKGVRKFTAAAMVSSAFTAPHVNEFLTVDVTPTMELLAKLKASRAFAGLKLTPLTIVAKALCIAVGRNPSLNSRWDEANQEIVTMSYVNLGIAAATPRGLTVPNIKDAEAKTLVEVAQALAELTDTARAGKTTPESLSGGTISITNIGVFGIDAGTPILNPGEAGILAIGSVRKQPWAYQDEVALRQVMTLSLSFDHRLVDGEQGSKFLADIGTILSDPGMLITMI
ncbi:dihydrolipoamide acetyltransferase component of pyruvate dehydrogenase complex [Renibacterium salmoninarum ATCC 33209]|uniref:Dihydrolipoamide acetyltransferase component of pyruvate dehydrogenase complex n=1 Tax=Renibacterium salmoninarum (strain ATCC 33209 / DSM 20767 / JCM 11484 / NBRC 15589 / NCIMB 2235) TaxID=288705 RepID=A9WL28_RENSM|nr:dihydrolipoamide acetyltransferase family protein [Renibacterium salmoninarum]ABY22297.1 dihydrolipoamide acetyltransferase component of pyruvate dehydrogenase complex [Renibacterium salmoninarum ATCC 33209]